LKCQQARFLGEEEEEEEEEEKKDDINFFFKHTTKICQTNATLSEWLQCRPW